MIERSAATPSSGLREVLGARVGDRQVLHVVARRAERRERLAARERVGRVVGGDGEHGVDGVVGVAAVAQDALQAPDEELLDRGAGRLGVERQHAVVAGERRADERRRASASVPPSSICSTPMALRRSAYGSAEPVGAMPAAKMPAMVSSLSAIATMRPASVAGSSSPAKRGR